MSRRTQILLVLICFQRCIEAFLGNYGTALYKSRNEQGITPVSRYSTSKINNRQQRNADRTFIITFDLLAELTDSQASLTREVISSPSKSVNLLNMIKLTAKLEDVIPRGCRLYQYVMRAKSLDIENARQVCEFIVELFQGETESIYNLLSSHPRILRRSVTNQLIPTVEFLEELYGKRTMHMAIRRNPGLLLLSGVGFYSNKATNDHEESVECFLMEELGMSSTTIRSFKKSAPFIFCRSVIQHLRPIVEFMAAILTEAKPTKLNLPRLNLEDSTRRKLVKIVSQNPTLLYLTLESNLYPTLECLKENFGMDAHSLSCMLRSCPSILGLSVEDNLRLTRQFLVEQLELTDPNDLSRCVKRHPQILALSLENLNSKVRFFQSLESFGDAAEGYQDHDDEFAGDAFQGPNKSLACRIAVSAPSAYSLSLKDNLKPKIATLAKLWGASPEELNYLVEQSTSLTPPCPGINLLAKQLKEYPNILTLSLETNLQPTIDFYNRTGYISLDSDGYLLQVVGDNVAETVKGNFEKPKTKRPTIMRARYLAASLYSRLLPRWHFVQEHRQTTDDLAVSDEEISHNIFTKAPPLHVLAMYDDAKFCDHFTLEVDDFVTYRKVAGKSLKFSTQFANWVKNGTPID